jgi:hypothetical protein
MLLLAYPGEVGVQQGKRGVPMGKGGGYGRHVAQLVLKLFGIPGSQRESETGQNADFLDWMLALDEAHEMALKPRVDSYEELVRFADPASELGRRRAEMRRYVEELGYDFVAWENPERNEQAEPSDEEGDGGAGATPKKDEPPSKSDVPRKKDDAPKKKKPK